mgnify:CR=1 FL=1
MYIEKINGPEDVKKLTVDEMTVMAGEMRKALLKRASIHGGHFGPNFGMVEATNRTALRVRVTKRQDRI